MAYLNGRNIRRIQDRCLKGCQSGRKEASVLRPSEGSIFTSQDFHSWQSIHSAVPKDPERLNKMRAETCALNMVPWRVPSLRSLPSYCKRGIMARRYSIGNKQGRRLGNVEEGSWIWKVGQGRPHWESDLWIKTGDVGSQPRGCLELVFQAKGTDEKIQGWEHPYYVWRKRSTKLAFPKVSTAECPFGRVST